MLPLAAGTASRGGGKVLPASEILARWLAEDRRCGRCCCGAGCGLGADGGDCGRGSETLLDAAEVMSGGATEFAAGNACADAWAGAGSAAGAAGGAA